MILLLNSPYCRDLIHSPPPAASTSCPQCCSGSCPPGLPLQSSCPPDLLLQASQPALAYSPADPKLRQVPGGMCDIISQNLPEPGWRSWSWEGLSLLIRGTIGAISGSNSKVEGGQLNPRIMGGSSTGAATKLFADLAKHSPP